MPYWSTIHGNKALYRNTLLFHLNLLAHTTYTSNQATTFYCHIYGCRISCFYGQGVFYGVDSNCIFTS